MTTDKDSSFNKIKLVCGSNWNNLTNKKKPAKAPNISIGARFNVLFKDKHKTNMIIKGNVPF